jgi:hypothetical protein
VTTYAGENGRWVLAHNPRLPETTSGSPASPPDTARRQRTPGRRCDRLRPLRAGLRPSTSAATTPRSIRSVRSRSSSAPSTSRCSPPALRRPRFSSLRDAHERARGAGRSDPRRGPDHAAPLRRLGRLHVGARMLSGERSSRPGSATESREPRAESREPRAESREPRAESREPRACLVPWQEWQGFGVRSGSLAFARFDRNPLQRPV